MENGERMKKSIRLFAALSLLTFGREVKVRCQTLYFPPTSGPVWDTLSLESQGWCRDKIPTLHNYLKAKNTKAFIVLKDGKIIIEKYFDKFIADSIWYWASAGKTLTGFTVGIAQQDGLLSIDDKSSKYLGVGWTEGAPEKEALITIKNQLSMTTGLDDGIPDNHCTLDTCLQYLSDAGKRWAYHNAPYTLLDKVLETATGKSLNNYITLKIGTPTGIKGLFIKLGYDNVFFSTPRSMARFGLLMLSKGQWNGLKVLSDTAYFRQMIHSSQTLNHSYGYLTWLNGQKNYMVPGLQWVIKGSLNPNAPDDMYSAMGKNGQFMNVVPSQNLVVIRMGNAPDGNEVPFLMNDTIFMLLKKVMCSASGIQEKLKYSEAITIYPNPADGKVKLKIQGEWPDKSKIQIFNPLGIEVFQSNYSPNNDSVELDLGGWPSGIYILKIAGPGKEAYRRFFLK